MTSVLVFGYCVIISLVVALGSVSAQSTRAFFIFGDSLVDSGNNDFLATTARADAPPYGIDYPTHRPTGRFSNGLNIPDIISLELGLEPTLPYLSPLLVGEKLLIGANFASAGIGILNDTGIQFLHIIHIQKQLKLFHEYQLRLSAHIGADGARNLVNRALVLITLGGNDFVNNYYLVPYSARSRQFSLPDYVRYIISEYRKVLRNLYDLGARRVLVTGTGPMGCVPAELAMRSRTGDCDVELQRAAALYNPQLVEMIKGLNQEIGSDVFIAANAYRMHMDFVSNPRAYGQALGAESTLPYLSPELNGERLLVGANFASAGIGILNDTGIQFVNIIRIYRQLEYFQEYQQRVSGLIGPEQTARLVNGALVLITLGGNDFVNNYYLVPFSARSRQYNLPDYVKYIISEYKKILRRLYELGARRVLVTGTGPLGCVPAELAQRSSNGECSVELQRAASLFNPQLVQIIQQLNSEIGSNVFVGVNTALMHVDFVSNPQQYGFITSKVACCGQGPYNGLGLCTVASNLCPNRDEYAFWDPFHPSEKANKLIVRQILSGTTDYMYPMNLSTILALDSNKN